MIFLLRVKEMTVSQIADELHVTPQAVYHHIKKLQKGDLVEVAREERIGHLIESYYRTTAETFTFSLGKSSHSAKVSKEQINAVLDALKKVGFKVEYNKDIISQLVSVQADLEKCCQIGEFESKISELEDVDFPTKLTVTEWASILLMSDEQFAKDEELRRKFRNLLTSLIKKQ
jgi:predicted ArsR family transcriptional regulator